MEFDLNLNSTDKLPSTIDALNNASQDGYKLSAYEKTLILDASFILQALFDQTAEGRYARALIEHRKPKEALGETK